MRKQAETLTVHAPKHCTPVPAERERARRQVPKDGFVWLVAETNKRPKRHSDVLTKLNHCHFVKGSRRGWEDNRLQTNQIKPPCYSLPFTRTNKALVSHPFVGARTKCSAPLHGELFGEPHSPLYTASCIPGTTHSRQKTFSVDRQRVSCHAEKLSSMMSFPSSKT